MTSLPGITLGGFGPASGWRAVFWGLLEAMRGTGLQVQSFLSSAHFSRYHGAATAAGLNPRHLDSWLMSPEQCAEIFTHGCENADFSLVHGQYSLNAAEDCVGSSLDTLCRWLQLPRVLVMDVAELKTCQIPAGLQRMDAMILDGVASDRQLACLATELEAICGIPVVGALGQVPHLRAAVKEVPLGTRPSRELCEQLGREYLHAAVYSDCWRLQPAPWSLIVRFACCPPASIPSADHRRWLR